MILIDIFIKFLVTLLILGGLYLYLTLNDKSINEERKSNINY